MGTGTRACLFFSCVFGCTADQFTSPDGGDDASAEDVATIDAPKNESGPPIDAGPPCNASAPFVVVSIDSLNTAADESSFRLVSSSLYGVFSSNRTGTMGANDLYSTSRGSTNLAYGSITSLGPLNSAKEDVDPWISDDGLTIYFASNRYGTFDIFKATRANATLAFNAPATVSFDTVEDETQPYVTSDGKDMYFSAVRVVSGPTFDIYHSTWNGSAWSAPAIISSVSSSSDDDEPVVTNDKLTMYFASARNNGQMDIFVSTRGTTSDAFGSPKPVNELNDSAKDDRPAWVSNDGCAVVFHSNRAAAQPGFNIYVGVKPQ